MNIHKDTPACHSDKNPIRLYVAWAREKNQYCYMRYEQFIATDHGCAGCTHVKDERITQRIGLPQESVELLTP